MTESNKKFVIQKHTCPVRCSENADKSGPADLSNGASGNNVHWDLMLEAQQELETYRLNLPPEELAKGVIASAEKIFNHPLKFLTYEGSVNKGRGTVEITESGTYRFLSRDGYQLEIQLDGKILQGRFTLTHIKENCWEFELAADR